MDKEKTKATRNRAKSNCNKFTIRVPVALNEQLEGFLQQYYPENHRKKKNRFINEAITEKLHRSIKNLHRREALAGPGGKHDK